MLGLEVVLADGSVIRTGSKLVKDVAGYALTHLFVGSQGTLGIITEATLRLRPLPPPRSTVLAFFPSIDAAGDAVARITTAGITRSPSSSWTSPRSRRSTTPTTWASTAMPRRC